MAGSSNQFTYQLGVTLFNVGSAVGALQVIPPRGCNGVYFGLMSGQTWAISNAAGMSIGNSFVLSATERLNFDGPATFFLAAGGATAVVGIGFKYSAGFSQLP